MKAEQILFSQGFGTRYDCRALILNGFFKVGDVVVNNPEEDVPVDHLVFSVRGESWPFFEKVIILLNKPAGFECSLKPRDYPSVLSILPSPLRARNVQPVGRLDADTTGLLILTDDGALNHRLTHPKHHIAKTYLITTKHPIDERHISQLLSGVKLADSDEIVKADSCRQIADCELELTILQGKYHQVKRMISAISNRCEVLKRIKFGKLSLPEDLPEGKWIWINGSSEIF